MMTRKSNIRGAITSLLLLIAGHGVAYAETKLAQPWADREFINNHGPYSSILVIGIPDHPQRRQQLERAFAKSLSSKHTTVLASLDVMSPDVEISEQSVKSATTGKGIDAVVLTRLFRIEEIEEVQGDDPGTKRSERDFALGLWGDWANARDFALDAATKKRLRLVLENNFYDLDSAELIWTVQSYSMDPKSAEEVIKSLSKLIAGQLKEHKLVR